MARVYKLAELASKYAPELSSGQICLAYVTSNLLGTDRNYFIDEHEAIMGPHYEIIENLADGLRANSPSLANPTKHLFQNTWDAGRIQISKRCIRIYSVSVIIMPYIIVRAAGDLEPFEEYRKALGVSLQKPFPNRSVEIEAIGTFVQEYKALKPLYYEADIATATGVIGNLGTTREGD